MSGPVENVLLRTPRDLGPTAHFGVAELTRALEVRGYRLNGQEAQKLVVVATAGDRLAPDNPFGPSLAEQPGAYVIVHGEGRPSVVRPDSKLTWTRSTPVALIGWDEPGLMYACLDLAEQLQMGTDLNQVDNRSAAPDLAVRGLYAFLHNAESEREWLYDPAYWQAYADELARCRFNRFNLIYGHQTAHLIPIYTHLLDDLDQEFPEIRADGITAEERARNLRALRTASAAMVRRGITFCLGIWNSRPWKLAYGNWETHPTRVTGTDDLAQLAAYTRKGFARLMELCPDIGAIQLRMNIESGVADQRFFVQAYVPALKELAARGRRLTVELRTWGLQPETVEAFHEAGHEIVVSTKYFAEHQGLPYQPPAMRGSYSYDSFLRKDKPFPFQWHLWSLGSHRLFAWGDPDYAARFAESCRLGDGVGFEVTLPGSQKGFSQWGAVAPGDWQPRKDVPAQRDFERYWFFLLAFGRMGYESSTSYKVFLHQLARRTTPEAAPAMLAAYCSASRVVSYLITQRMDDPNMYVWPELDCGGPIDHNSIAPPGDSTLFSTARQYADDRVAGRGSAKRSPFDAARDLTALADEIEAGLATLAGLPDLADKLEYRAVRTDFAALAALARYQAAKSRATGNLALFYARGERWFLDAAESDAEEGVRLWDELCARTEAYHDTLHFGPSGGHWRDNRPRVEYDLRRIRRVRELFEASGLFVRGFDFGLPFPERVPPRAFSGLEPEPRFIGVDARTDYSAERGYGWLRPAGLRSAGYYQLPRELLWGVHYIVPGVEYDPAAVRAMPLDGLTQRYLTADEPRTFQVDLPDGEYEIVLFHPATSPNCTAQLEADPIELGRPGPTMVKQNMAVSDGALRLTMSGRDSWALAGLAVRRRAPEVAHLPPVGAHGEEDLVLTMTATSPDGIRSAVLRYPTDEAGTESSMDGDGVAFSALIPTSALVGDVVEYEFVVESTVGQVTRQGGFRVPIIHGFQPPRVDGLHKPGSWGPDDDLVVRVSLTAGEFAQAVRLHYREADQNRDFSVATLPGGRSGGYVFRIDTRYLDPSYDLLYYVEVVDVRGGGSFYPDPFSGERYFICRAG